MEEYTITLKASELQYLVNLAQERPHREVDSLITSIKSQVAEQESVEN